MTKSWILHDSYKSFKEASEYGKLVMEVKLAKGVKIMRNKDTIYRYDLFIVPLFALKGN